MELLACEISVVDANLADQRSANTWPELEAPRLFG